MNTNINFTLFKQIQIGGRKKNNNKKKYKITNKYNINELNEKPLMILKMTDNNVENINEKINYK